MTEDNTKQDANAPDKPFDPKEDLFLLTSNFRSKPSILFTSPSGVGKTAMMKKMQEAFDGASATDGSAPLPVFSMTTSEDYKKAMAQNPALADRLKKISILPFAPLSSDAMVKIAGKILAKSPLSPEEQQALAEFIVEQYKAADEGGKQGARRMLKMVDEVMQAPLSAEAQAAVIKKLLSTSPLEPDQQIALADVISMQIAAQAHKVGNGGSGLKTAVDKTLEGPLSPDMEAVMIEKSPSYAAGVSRRNGEALAEGFTAGTDVQPMKTIQFKRN
ncbi:MAG: hypothetical protein ACAH83_13580 [Alphaproteobacteria bacterium]